MTECLPILLYQVRNDFDQERFTSRDRKKVDAYIAAFEDRYRYCAPWPPLLPMFVAAVEGDVPRQTELFQETPCA